MNVEGLTFSYPKSRTILNEVSFQLVPNKLNVLVGLNGSGKTTLFDCVTNVLKAQECTINFPPINEIMYLTQTLFFSRAIKGKDLVKYIYRLNNWPCKSDVNYYIESLNESEANVIKKLWDLRFGNMSVGERKLLFIILFSQVERSLFMFDEPTSGVDPISRLMIYNKLKELIAKGKTCFVTTHQLQDLTHLDCHMILLDGGVIRYEGDFNDWLALHDCDNPDEAFQKSITA